WLVSGESGIGKTRLLQELRTRALVNGALVLRGQASRDGGGAYHLWSDILRPLMLLAVPSDLEAAVLRPVVPDIERLLARSILDAPSLEPKAAQTRLLLTITELVRRGARHQPLLLLLDDIHWADDNSLELLPHLNRLAAELPLFIVAGYRPGERPKLQDQLTEMRHLPLSRLTPHSIATLSEAMLGVGGRRPQLVDFLQQESEGNTFFVVEVMRALAEEAGRLDQVAGMTLPLHVFAGGMQRMVQRRLGRVAATYQPLLQLAAVAGREIELGVLAHLAADIDLEEWLTACANAAILEIPDGGLRWQFSHDRLRDGLLTQLEPSQKRTQHERIGAACEQIYAADLSDHYADLAYHYGQTENIKKERRYTRLAGEQAAAQLANEEALTYLNRALDLTAKDDRVERYELLLAREKVYNVLGKRERQLQDLVALEELVGVQSKDARQPDSQQEAVGRLAELVLRQANYAEVTGDHQAAATTAQKAIDWAQTAGMVKREAKGYLQWGLSLWRQGTYEEAQLRLERALELARAAQLPQVKADTLQNLGTMFAHQGNYASANVYWQQALHLYHEMGDRRGESHILNNLGALCGFQADYVAGKAYFERALNLYHKMGDRRGESNALNNLGSIANYLGDYVDGRMYYERAFHLFRAVGDQHGEAMSLNNLGFVARCLGEYGESKACFDQSLRLRREIRDRHGQGLTHINLGALYHRPGDYAEAGSQWEQALRLFRELGDGRGESWTLNHLGLLLHHQGDDEMAQDYSQQALQISEEIGARSQQSYALTVRGHALAGLGHPAEATVAYRQVLALRRELGEHHFAMEVVAGLARVFLTQGELHQAQAQVEAVLHYLDTRTLEGTNEPFHIYLTCYRVLKATQDQRTEKILHDAYTLLQERAAKINDASQRYLFLHHVTAHHQIVAAWEEK
ncbi:MAG: tetratricopeptide repeat protein, partial [Anaerolineae bacterium]